MKKILQLALVGVVALGISACNREENNDWTFTTDNSIMEDAFQDVFKQTDETAQSDGNLRNACATISLDANPGTFPDTVTIDFSGSICNDGRIRSGRLVMYFTGRWRTPGSQVTITSDGYTVNGHRIIGSKVITNTTPAGSNNHSYTQVVNNARVVFPNGDTATWSCNKTITQTAGQNTTFATNGLAGITDDVYHITGSANGISRNGVVYSAVITEDLVRKMDCRWLVDGIIEVTPQGGSTRTADFGDGTCDNIVTLTFRRYSFNLNMQ
jgi:hypothetical protein